MTISPALAAIIAALPPVAECIDRKLPLMAFAQTCSDETILDCSVEVKRDRIDIEIEIDEEITIHHIEEAGKNLTMVTYIGDDSEKAAKLENGSANGTPLGDLIDLPSGLQALSRFIATFSAPKSNAIAVHGIYPVLMELVPSYSHFTSKSQIVKQFAEQNGVPLVNVPLASETNN